MSRRLFVGAKVTLDPLSPYCEENCPDNPRGIVGEVVRVTRESDDENMIWWRVNWSNGQYNSYRNGELKVLGTVIKEEN